MINIKILASSILLALSLLNAAIPSAIAQTQHNTAHLQPQIEGFNVDEVRRLVPGTELNFSLYGTPGGIASLRIAGATRTLALSEVEGGQYEGSYVISSRDKIAARSLVTANLRIGNQVASMVLNESLQIGVGIHAPKFQPGIQINISRFDLVPLPDLSPGTEMLFTLIGTPGGRVDLTITGVKAKILLPEIRNGEYKGSYTIKSRDRITPDSNIIATLHLNERGTEHVANIRYDQRLPVLAMPHPVQTSPVCYTCGTVEAINLVEVKGEGTYLGTIGGGVVGALLGSQIGGGSGRTAAEIAGALGGAYVGRNIEGNSRRVNHYEVIVRFQNGATQTVSYENDPGYRVGDKVQVRNGVIIHN